MTLSKIALLLFVISFTACQKNNGLDQKVSELERGHVQLTQKFHALEDEQRRADAELRQLRASLAQMSLSTPDRSHAPKAPAKAAMSGKAMPKAGVQAQAGKKTKRVPARKHLGKH